CDGWGWVVPAASVSAFWVGAVLQPASTSARAAKAGASLRRVSCMIRFLLQMTGDRHARRLAPGVTKKFTGQARPPIVPSVYRCKPQSGLYCGFTQGYSSAQPASDVLRESLRTSTDNADAGSVFRARPATRAAPPGPESIPIRLQTFSWSFPHERQSEVPGSHGRGRCRRRRAAA